MGIELRSNCVWVGTAGTMWLRKEDVSNAVGVSASFLPLLASLGSTVCVTFLLVPARFAVAFAGWRIGRERGGGVFARRGRGWPSRRAWGRRTRGDRRGGGVCHLATGVRKRVRTLGCGVLLIEHLWGRGRRRRRFLPLRCSQADRRRMRSRGSRGWLGRDDWYPSARRGVSVR